MLEPLPHDKSEAIKVAVSTSLALAFMVGDFLWLIRDEYKYIWPLWTSWKAKLYVLARYLGLASQIFNVYFAVRMSYGVYTSPSGCRIWFIFQAIVVQSLLILVEGLLMYRIYALFLRNRIILIMLISFALGQVVSMGVSAGISFPSNKHTVTCLLINSNPGNTFFSATTITTNVIICFMTFWRSFRLPATWTRQRLGQVILWDSAFSSSAITVMMIFLTLCSLQVIKPAIGGNITYYWFVCILWVSIGRIVVNHEKLPREEGESIWKETLQLTSQIEMGESPSLDTQYQSSDGHTQTSRTLQSTLTTKASQLSPSTACPSDSSRRWLGDHTPSYGHGDVQNLQPSSTELSPELSPALSIRRLPASNVCDRNSDGARTDASNQAHSHSPSPQPHSSQPPSSEPPPVSS